MIIEDEEDTKEIFIENINTIILDSMEISLSLYLLNELRKNKINVLFCDERHNPTIQFQPIYGCFDCASKAQRQLLWLNKNKIKVWIRILKNKINNQYRVLEKEKLELFDYLKYSDIKANDTDNVEGTVAKMYFNRLFGNDFNRREDNTINVMLNYGYSVVASCISRDIVSLGYLTTIGINHKCGTNNFNLSYDIIEPFRPFIDRVVYHNKNKCLDKETKQGLLEVLYTDCLYKNKPTKLINVISTYINDVVESIENGINKIGEIEIV